MNVPVWNIGGRDYNVKDTEARNKIDDLKSALIESVTPENGVLCIANVQNSADWEPGGLNSIGEEFSDDTNIRTAELVDLSGVEKLLINSDLQYWLFWYKENGAFLRREGGWDTGKTEYIISPEQKNYKILLHTPAISNYSKITVLSYKKEYFTKSNARTFADSGRINTEYLYADTDWSIGGINSLGLDDDNDTTHIRSKYIDVSNCSKIEIENGGVGIWAFWYDHNRKFVSRESGFVSVDVTYAIPSNINYCRFLANTSNVMDRQYFAITGDPVKNATKEYVDNIINDSKYPQGYAIKEFPVTSTSFVKGGLDSAGAFNPSGNYIVSPFLPINGADFIHIETSGYRVWPFWYTASRRFISREIGWQDGDINVKTIGKASFCRILIECTESANYFASLPKNKVYSAFEKKNNKKLILDTDMDLDVDDAVALRCAVWANRTKNVDLIGVTLSVNGSVVEDDVRYGSCQYVDAMLTYDGTPDIPIARNSHRSGHNCGYIKNVVKDFYHTVTTNDTLPEAVDFYRAALASLPVGQKTDICICGYLNSFAELINSAPDEYIDISGMDLIKDHVGTIYVMGGDYPASTGSAEGNFANGAGAVENTNTVLTANFDNPIIFLGRECGWPVQSGGSLADMPYDPLHISLKDYHGGTFGPRSSFDPLTLLIACLGNDKTGFNLTRGTNAINTDSESEQYGWNTFTENASGHHYYVSYRYEAMQYYVDLINTIIVRKAWV